MKPYGDMAVIVMASGFSTRFGSNKLAADLGGKSVIRRVLEAIPANLKTFVVTRYDFVKDAARERGFIAIDNPLPDLRDTIRLGLDAASDFPAACFMVADQPWIRGETIEKLRRERLAYPDSIIRAAKGGVGGNPVVFPRALFPELKALGPEGSGADVIKRHADLVRLVETDGNELRDIDTVFDL